MQLLFFGENMVIESHFLHVEHGNTVRWCSYLPSFPLAMSTLEKHRLLQFDFILFKAILMFSDKLRTQHTISKKEKLTVRWECEITKDP